MSENQIISFLEFTNQDDEDKYNMLEESAAIIRQKENIIKEVKEYINENIIGNYFERYDDEVYRFCSDILNIINKSNK